MDSAEDNAGRPWRRQGVFKLAAVVVGLVVLVLVGREVGGHVPRFAAWVEGLGVWGPLVFVAGYVVATVAFVPGALLTLAAGAIFGIVEGVAYVFVGASLGATLAFLLGRYAARSAVERRLAENEKFRRVERSIESEGLKIVVLLRLSPAFPFNLLNYGLGLTSVRLRDYVIAHLGMLPGTLLYVYYGRVVGQVAALAAGATPERGAGYWTVFALGLAATLAVTVIVTRIARNTLREEGVLENG